ncbi:MAG: AtzE family amidohydrolase [Cyanobacteria bacterium P01_H01_bin.15]
MQPSKWLGHSAITIVRAVKTRQLSVVDYIEAVLKQAEIENQRLNCFTALTHARARQQASVIEERLNAGNDPGPLAGVPFAVKNLFEIAGLTTLAGSRILASEPPATRDATVVSRLIAAGAVLIGATNMDEFAYGFTTENHHYGPTRNPLDISRVAGGSSGGSAAAVAGDIVLLALGSDTNGSIRVPAALCGILGIRPTFDCLPTSGMLNLASTLDTPGLFARSVADLQLAFGCLTAASSSPTARELRIGIADGYFQDNAESFAIAAVQKIAEQLGVAKTVTIPAAAEARAAAYLITVVEGANLHREQLKTRPQDFDPLIRDRFLAGLLVPADWYVQAQKFRQWYCAQIAELFSEIDIILAPVTPYPAPLIGQSHVTVAGKEILARPNLGQLTQPLSLAGLPTIAGALRDRRLSCGLQIVAAPHREADLWQVAQRLQSYWAAGVS